MKVDAVVFGNSAMEINNIKGYHMLFFEGNCKSEPRGMLLV